MQVEDSHQTKGLLRLTMACNERCPFCNVPMEDYRLVTPAQSEIDRKLQSFFDSGQKSLTISGGEPTLLRSRLLSLIKQARAGGIQFVELQTNAVLIDSEFARELVEAGLTSAFVSLLSHLPERHDELAGLVGAFSKCVQGILALGEAGVTVTLNPVIARSTQELVPEYVEFVAAHLPCVKSISFSAVQPHGRAANNPDLLPDYAVLRERMPAAVSKAESYGIRALNPYCGLPVCVGWTGKTDSCVEWQEASAGLGWRERPGLRNVGDKSQGEPCVECAYRTRCGGAWHAYWRTMGASGISPPALIRPPWLGGVSDSNQHVVKAFGGLNELSWRALENSKEPTVWLWADEIKRADLGRIFSSTCTEIAWLFSVEGLLERSDKATENVRTLRRLSQLLGLQERQRLHLIVTNPDPSEKAAVLHLSKRIGVSRVYFLEQP